MSPPFRLVGSAGEFRALPFSTPGMRRFGVPEGGPFDRESFALALALVGGSAPPMVREIAGLATLEFDRPGTLAVVGADVRVVIGDQERPANAAWPVSSGARVGIWASRLAARCYLAWSEDLSPERRLATPPTSLRPGPIRIVRGPDDVALPLEGWTVSPSSNRLGLRLQGAGVPHRVELPSRPTVAGTIQVTPSGMPILLGPDGPTIGGYPQAAVVIDADRDRLAQLLPGQSVTFAWVSLDDAQRLRREYRRALQARLAQLGIPR